VAWAQLWPCHVCMSTSQHKPALEEWLQKEWLRAHECTTTTCIITARQWEKRSSPLKGCVWRPGEAETLKWMGKICGSSVEVVWIKWRFCTIQRGIVHHARGLINLERICWSVTRQTKSKKCGTHLIKEG
jgi:hypothetical protein